MVDFGAFSWALHCEFSADRASEAWVHGCGVAGNLFKNEDKLMFINKINIHKNNLNMSADHFKIRIFIIRSVKDKKQTIKAFLDKKADN